MSYIKYLNKVYCIPSIFSKWSLLWLLATSLGSTLSLMCGIVMYTSFIALTSLCCNYLFITLISTLDLAGGWGSNGTKSSLFTWHPLQCLIHNSHSTVTCWMNDFKRQCCIIAKFRLYIRPVRVLDLISPLTNWW